MFTITSGVLLYAVGLIVLDQSLRLPVETSMMYDLTVFYAGSLLSIVGVYVSAIRGIAMKRTFRKPV